MTNQQQAVANYYDAILKLEKANVIDDRVGDELSISFTDLIDEFSPYTIEELTND